MRHSRILTCLLAALPVFLYGQNNSDTMWLATPKKYTVPEMWLSEPAVVIEENAQIEYTDEMIKGESELVQYITYHRIVKVLDEKGVEAFNKFTFPFSQDRSVEWIKARTILPNGNVMEVPKEKMKESTDENGNKVISFAMDGVEKKADVEFYVRFKKPAILFGRESFQSAIPTLHASFDLVSPARIKCEEKGYNQFPTVADTLTGTTRRIHAEYSNIPGLHEEPYSFDDLYAVTAEYKVSYLPETKGTVRMFTWQEMAQRLYTAYYQFTDKEVRAVEKFLKTSGVAVTDKEEDKIIKIEEAIKSGINVYKEINDEDAGNVDYVIAKKAATQTGLVRLFSACYTAASVKHELGIATNRRQKLFDEDFENWNSLENFLFYFPNQRKFLSPESIYLRYPFATSDVITNKALFCKVTTLGGNANAIADIRTVTPVAMVLSQNNINADITFSADMEPLADVTYSFTGYTASGLREYFVLLPKDKIAELVQGIAGLAEKPENMIKYTVSGEAFDNYSSDKPLKLVVSVKAPQLVEKAGPKYIFKIGDIIGKQSELYQEKERKLPIDIAYPHAFNRTITVTIPDGYKILNPEAIKIDVDCRNESGEVKTSFHSDYKLENNKLIVNIAESYDQLHFPASSYEPFRKVINAAADFNKVTLLLSK